MITLALFRVNTLQFILIVNSMTVGETKKQQQQQKQERKKRRKKL